LKLDTTKGAVCLSEFAYLSPIAIRASLGNGVAEEDLGAESEGLPQRKLLLRDTW
jgi:hypothetical protein